jgi:biotin operon repressor
MSDPRFSIIPTRAIDDSRLSKPSLLVLCALGTYGDKAGWCHPSQGTIAQRLGVSRQAVGKCIKELEQLGYLEKRRRFGEDGRELASQYRILFDAELPAEFDRTLQSEVAWGATSEVAGGATSEVAGGATSEVAQTPHTNAPYERNTVADPTSGGPPPNRNGKKTQPQKPDPESKTGQTWNAYRSTYQARYGVEPIRNAKVNAQLSQLVDRIGAELAPQVARFYVNHPLPFYASRLHPVDLLLRDAEVLATEYSSGRTRSGTASHQKPAETEFVSRAQMFGQR